MAYAPLDEHFDEHPKYEALELEHFGLMACAIAYCNRLLTDGFVSDKALRAFGRSGKGTRAARVLVEKGIWERVENGFRIVGFLDHNPSRDDVLARREAARLRKDKERSKDKSSSTPEVRVPRPVTLSVTPPVTTSVTSAVTSESHDPSRVTSRAGGIRSTALHCTAIQEIPPTPQGGHVPSAIVAAPELDRPRISRFEEPFWRTAYVETVRAVLRGPWSFPDRQGRSVRAAVEGHCRELADIDGWLRREVAAFVAAVRDQAPYYAALGPDGFLKWLNEESARAPARRAEAPPPPSVTEDRDCAPPTPEEADALAQVLRELVEPPTAAPSGVRASSDISDDRTPAEAAVLEARRLAAVKLLQAEASADAARAKGQAR